MGYAFARRAAMAALAGTSLFAISAPAFAADDQPQPDQAAQADNAAAVDDGAIIVTARRRDETLQSTPVAITAVNTAMLEAKAAVNIGDLQGAAPGLLITQQNSGAQAANISIRGLTYASPRVNGVQMTPTQFPDGHRMVVEAAARFGFLLAIPAVFSSGLYELYKVLAGKVPAGMYTMGQTAVATLIAFAVGYLIIGWFMHYISERSYSLFVWYRIALGALVFVLLGAGAGRDLGIAGDQVVGVDGLVRIFGPGRAADSCAMWMISE